MEVQEIKQTVKTRYGNFAETGGKKESCWPSKEQPGSGYAVDQALYGQEDLSLVPQIGINLSRGCGNPTGFANLQLGDVVVDFGCGGGIDVVIAAHKVGIQGKVVGVDFTPQMIERAKETTTEAGLQDRDIELHVADLGNTKLPNKLADVVISNCVINLCPDKEAVYLEAYRILKPGGRLAISDIVLTEEIDSQLRKRFLSIWPGCLGGAMFEEDYWQTVKKAGFDDIKIVTHHVLTPKELEAMACCPGEEFSPPTSEGDRILVEGKVSSIKFTAVKSSQGWENKWMDNDGLWRVAKQERELGKKERPNHVMGLIR